MRVLVAWCPSWPVAALGFADDEPAAVIERGRIIATSRAARAAGVTVGQRRRQAEHLCPGLTVAVRDPAVEARSYEPVVAAIGELTPLVEVTRPGICALDPRGPARYFGGESALCARIVEVTAETLPTGAAPLRVGIAEGRFAATLAARHGVVVAVDKTAAFLAPLTLVVLDDPELVDLLIRLGISTLGEFAALPADAVRARFGERGTIVHRRACGFDDERLCTEPPGEQLRVQTEFDPPAERVDVAAFVTRLLVDDFVSALEGRGLVCERLRIEAETDHGEALARLWRSEESFTRESVVERLRWQLEGWLAGSVPEPTPTAGITLLRIIADEVHLATDRQLGLFGGRSDVDIRAARALNRLRGLLGPEAVFTAVLRGGRSPGERVMLIPWGEPAPVINTDEPWPGRHPLPAPALVYEEPISVEVLGEDDRPVRVLKRGVLPSAPRRISIDGGPWTGIVAWSGPWLIDERSWDEHTRRRRSRFQLLTADCVGHLCVVEANRWWIEATYD